MAVIALFFGGCKTVDSDPNQSEPTQPFSPPMNITAEAFSIQVSLFYQNTGDVHFQKAASIVKPISSKLNDFLNLSEVATAAAYDTTPEQDGDTYIWSASIATENGDLTYSLSGLQENSTVSWSMVVTYSDSTFSYNNFEIYTASTNLEGNSGTSQIFDLVDGKRVIVLDTKFDISSKTTSDIAFDFRSTTIGEPRGDLVYIEQNERREFKWASVGAKFYDRINWNPETKVGSILKPRYNNHKWSCWDENLNNITC